MPLHPLFGHDGVKRRLAGALSSGRLPQVLLLEGPQSVGKQRLALWLAQLICCDGAAPGAQEPCGECRSCRLALDLKHPDIHWFVPVELTKKGADADKQVDLVEEALAEEMASRRERPLYGPAGGLASHGIASVRLLLRRVTLTPVMGRRKVVLVGDAERLIPQQGADAAANALLKALEEPPADTVFVLTAADPEALLPTVLSRVVRVRVARNADTVLTAFAQDVLGLRTKDDVAQRVSNAEGCVGRLLASDGGATGTREAADRLFKAGYAFALGQMPFQARGGFTAILDTLAGRLRAQAKAGGETDKVVEAIVRVLDARELAQGNVNPQLIAAVLAEDLTGGGGGGGRS